MSNHVIHITSFSAGCSSLNGNKFTEHHKTDITSYYLKREVRCKVFLLVGLTLRLIFKPKYVNFHPTPQSHVLQREKMNKTIKKL